jgi:hypothetical protein
MQLNILQYPWHSLIYDQVLVAGYINVFSLDITKRIISLTYIMIKCPRLN